MGSTDGTQLWRIIGEKRWMKREQDIIIKLSIDSICNCHWKLVCLRLISHFFFAVVHNCFSFSSYCVLRIIVITMSLKLEGVNIHGKWNLNDLVDTNTIEQTRNSF